MTGRKKTRKKERDSAKMKKLEDRREREREREKEKAEARVFRRDEGKIKIQFSLSLLFPFLLISPGCDSQSPGESSLERKGDPWNESAAVNVN